MRARRHATPPLPRDPATEKIGRGRLDTGAGRRQSLPRRQIVAGLPAGSTMDPRPHIVVVEDEATQRQLLADYLAGQNFRVSAVDSGAALHRLVEREAPA